MSTHTRFEDTGESFELGILYPRGKLPQKPPDVSQYKPLREAIEYCLTQNPNRYPEEQLSDPQALIINNIHTFVVQELGLEDFTNLMVIPASKTWADRYHGIDYFFIYRDPETDQSVMVTVDATKRPLEDKRDYPADIIHNETEIRGVGLHFSVPEISHATSQEQQQRDEDWEWSIGKAVAEVIREKIKNGDPKYSALYPLDTRLHIERLFGSERAGVPSR